MDIRCSDIVLLSGYDVVYNETIKKKGVIT